jgi:hypothetical protein
MPMDDVVLAVLVEGVHRRFPAEVPDRSGYF